MRTLVRMVLLVAASSAFSAAAAVQMIVTPLGTKSSAAQPAGVKSVAQPIRFNLEELRTLKPGAEVELTLPNARKHTFVFDLARDHGNGIVSWVGYYRDADQRRKLRAIVTTGPDGAYGTIQTPQGEMRIVPGRGHDWLVDMTAEDKHHPAIDVAADALTPPPQKKAARVDVAPLAQADYAQSVPGVNVPKSASASTPALVTIDILFVYTAGLANKLQGSQMQTRIAQLVTAANTAFADSHVGIQVRAAGSVMVDYSDAIDDTTALNDITWARVPAFANISNVRDSVGADLVTFLRSGNDLAGTGLSWVPPHPVAAADASTMYSMVTGCTSGCEWLWMHEIGHNMGNAHDRATIAWEVSGLKQGESRGSYDYSYGFYTCDGVVSDTALTCSAFSGGCTGAEPQCKASNPNRNYADLMAYFHGSTRVMQYSNPDLDCADSGLPCGLPDGYLDGSRVASANAALTLNNNRVALSALRSVSTTSSQASSGVSIASSANPARAGMGTVLTASVMAYTNGNFVPVNDGTVHFRVNGGDIAGCTAVAVSAGQARCATSFGAGSFTITGDFAGSATYPAASSVAFTQVIAAVPAMARTLRARKDFNGDSRGDIAWIASGATAISLMNGTAATTATVAAPAGATLRATGDFDGDGRTDIVWRGADGSYSISLMDGAKVRTTAQVLGAGSGWDLVGVADLDGDGRADLVWNSPSGQFGAWLMNGTSAKAYTGFATPMDNATLVALADFNGDRLPDLLWRGADGSIALTLQANGGTVSNTTLMGGGMGWTPARVADLNGDGLADILLTHPDGRIAAWIMNGSAIAAGRTLVDAGSGWKLVAAADLDGDGKADLLFGAADQTASAWLMDGLAPKSTGMLVSAPNSGWSLFGTADLDGDGRCDILWRRGPGDYAAWFMNGLQASAYATLAPGSGAEISP